MDDVREHYKRITTGLIVCLVLVVLVGIVLAVLVGKDCLVGRCNTDYIVILPAIHI